MFDVRCSASPPFPFPVFPRTLPRDPMSFLNPALLALAGVPLHPPAESQVPDALPIPVGETSPRHGRPALQAFPLASSRPARAAHALRPRAAPRFSAAGAAAVRIKGGGEIRPHGHRRARSFAQHGASGWRRLRATAGDRGSGKNPGHTPSCRTSPVFTRSKPASWSTPTASIHRPTKATCAPSTARCCPTSSARLRQINRQAQTPIVHGVAFSGSA